MNNEIQVDFYWNIGSWGTTWLPLVTFVGWASTLLIGLIGFTIPYDRPRPPEVEPELHPIEAIEVSLSSEPKSIPEWQDPKNPKEPPSLIDPIKLQETLPLPVVANLNEDLVVAIPVDGPVTIVDAKNTSFFRTQNTQPIVAASAPSISNLTFGSGEGRQPAPRYPHQAMREGQEGSVTIVFSVNPEGRVIETKISRPCPWPLLNKEAEHVIKQRWRFPNGTMRRYRVTIQFKLTQS